MLKGIIFDLDGTLIDSFADIGNSAEYVFAQHGLPSHPLSAYKDFIGNGMAKLVERAVPADISEQQREQLVREVSQHYTTNWAVETKPYPGVVELLRILTKKDITMMVLSNKVHAFTVAMVQHFFSDTIFADVRGQKEHAPLKPLPDVPQEMLKQQGLLPNEVLFVGDLIVDVMTAKAADIISVGCLWGFRPTEAATANHVIAHPTELLPLLEIF